MTAYAVMDFFSCNIGNFVPYVTKTLRGMHTMCRGKLLRSRTLARKVYKSLMGEGYRELKWTCPLYLRTD